MSEKKFYRSVIDQKQEVAIVNKTKLTVNWAFFFFLPELVLTWWLLMILCPFDTLILFVFISSLLQHVARVTKRFWVPQNYCSNRKNSGIVDGCDDYDIALYWLPVWVCTWSWRIHGTISLNRRANMVVQSFSPTRHGHLTINWSQQIMFFFLQ